MINISVLSLIVVIITIISYLHEMIILYFISRYNMIIDEIIVDSPDDDHIIKTARMVKGLGDMYRLLIIVILA